MQINDLTGHYAKNSSVSKERREAYHHSHSIQITLKMKVKAFPTRLPRYTFVENVVKVRSSDVSTSVVANVECVQQNKLRNFTLAEHVV